MTGNHGYHTPELGTEDWHIPLNENFEALETDVEIRDVAANRDEYEPEDGAKFLELDSGIVYVGDGDEWVPALAMAFFADDGELHCGELTECITDEVNDSNSDTLVIPSAFGVNAKSVHQGAIVFGDSTQRSIWSKSANEIRSQMPMHTPSFHTARVSVGERDVDVTGSVRAGSVDTGTVEADSVDVDDDLSAGLVDTPTVTSDGELTLDSGGDDPEVTLTDEEVESTVPLYAPEFNTTSASAAKTAVQAVDPETVLDGVESLEVATWELTDQDGGRHMGPMAEAFAETFELGSSDESIATVDADGVAFAAIQGLSNRLEEKDERIEELEAETADLRDKLERLERAFDAKPGPTPRPVETDD